jgi:adenylyl-sulfate kinase
MTSDSPPGFTLWFTGLPCSGKSTLARLVTEELERRHRAVELLDGDVIRSQWTRTLGFSRQDREENIRRIAFGCRLLSKHGIVAVAAVISPFRAMRDEVRASVPHFVEVYVDAPVEVCIQRDVKGMYKKALAGELSDFTGVDAPYEPPLQPELVIPTATETPDASVRRIFATLKSLSLVR